MTAPIRVLLLNEAANPEWSSVPLVGWSHGAALAKLAQVHTVTQVRNREAFLRAGWREGTDFTAIDSEAVARPLYRLGEALRGGQGKGWTTAMAFSALAYYEFERRVWRRFGADIRAGAYDIVHRLTPLSPTIPSTLAKRCRKAGVPFVWGPINGGAPWPPAFDTVRRKEREWLSYVRDVYRFLPAYRSTRADAAGILVGSGHTWDQLPRAFRDKYVYQPENGVDPNRFAEPVDGPVRQPLHVAFVGRLTPYKGAGMLLEAALPLLRDRKLVLDIIGDGPEMDGLRATMEREKMRDSVLLPGWIPHADLPKRLIQSDVFAFPSVREFGGGVIIEAMALGLVPIVADYAGPAELVTPDTGALLPLSTRDALVRSLHDALAACCARPESIRPMGARARERALSLFTWEAKARQTLEVYEWLLHRRPDKPVFPFHAQQPESRP